MENTKTLRPTTFVTMLPITIRKAATREDVRMIVNAMEEELVTGSDSVGERPDLFKIFTFNLCFINRYIL